MSTSLLAAATLHRREGVLAARALPCLGFPALKWPVVLVVGEALLPLAPVPLVELLAMLVEALVPPVVQPVLLVGEAMRCTSQWR